jgi:hypothetical protein
MQSGDVPEMLAYLPQSNAADILWTRLPALEAFAGEFDGHLVTTVHDSFLLEFPTDHIGRDLLRSLRSVLECDFPNIAPGFQVPVNLKMGSNRDVRLVYDVDERRSFASNTATAAGSARRSSFFLANGASRGMGPTIQAAT